MSIAPKLHKYLTDHNVAYDVISHAPTSSSSRTAQEAHIPGDNLAKAVVIKDDESYMVAVVPASAHIQLGELSRVLDRQVGLATEAEASELFTDCELGAFPAIGYAYGLDMIVDDSIVAQSDVYMEGGDHQNVVHLTGEQFRSLTADTPHGSFSVHD